MARIHHFIALALIVIIAPFSAQADEDGARDFVQKLGDNVLAIVEDAKLTEDQKEDRLAVLFSAAVDVDWIGKFALGKYWRRATDEQKTRYQELYRPFLLHGYASRFKEYKNANGEGFVITGSRELRENEHQVDSKILRNGEPPVIVSYRIRYDTGSYKLFDVIIEGVSQLATQRSEFGSLISNKGLDYLIERLEIKVKEFTRVANNHVK